MSSMLVLILRKVNLTGRGVLFRQWSGRHGQHLAASLVEEHRKQCLGLSEPISR